MPAAADLFHRSSLQQYFVRVPTHPGKSWIFSRPWKVLENQFGPGKYLKMKILDEFTGGAK